MKGLYYLILFVAFLMYYQKNRVFTVLIILFGLGAYFFIKSKGKRNKTIKTGFLSGKSSLYDESSNSILAILMFQQLLDSEGYDNKVLNTGENSQKKNEIDKIKQKIQNLFN